MRKIYQSIFQCKRNYKMRRKICIFYISYLFFFFGVKTIFAKEKAVCWDHQKILFEIKQSATAKGGIWEIYEKIPETRTKSSEGLNLDGKINQIIEIGEYLCRTLDGVPLTGLAVYILNHLDKMGENAFHDQLLEIRGKTEKEIARWFNYAKIARGLRKRTLDLSSVINTLNRAKEIIVDYKGFINSQKDLFILEHLHRKTQSLIKQIDQFFKSDPNMSMAIFEKAQEPYWDISEGDVG